MYQFTPDEIDRKRANHQAVKQGADDVDAKRIGNLGEIAFEQFCREYLPAEMWEWKNEDAIRRCNPESFSGHDFEVFGYEIDVKTSRDVSAFHPETLVENDSDDDILVMVWHRDNEDSLIMLGWERVETLKSKVETEQQFSGNSPDKLEHLATRPMNELRDLGPNTANMNQKPENPFQPGDRVEKRGEEESSVGVVVEVLPPETQIELYGQELDGEGVRVTFPSSLDEGPGDWRDIDPALFSSYCDDQDVSLYTYKHANLKFADNPFTVGDYVIKSSHDDPDPAVVVDVDGEDVSVVYEGPRGDEVSPANLKDHCEAEELSTYSYSHDEMEFIASE
ncbi:hypothetical protein [Haloarcula pellucida]|uniref:Uncharacterized protein n=1 Tax=Haloarcula pellucida TaxID=1427151 RepID=A0A830GRZ8_9EURY|nr:hypothetical protein [Halomicroarcula pellucida]MBX0349416.1 hypothetical protein [Halomicroarcula pellucida]GGO03040.1 hypothetical protein GCM10009030_38290 [Halomicroarcula pellucida]